MPAEFEEEAGSWRGWSEVSNAGRSKRGGQEAMAAGVSLVIRDKC